VIFGGLYGMAYFALFRLFDVYGVPLFWDKLLPVPILNLCVPLFDRLARAGWIGRLNHAWEGALPPHRLNLVHMVCWVALFAAMWVTGFIEGPHQGNSIPFWKQALAEGKPFAAHSLVMVAGAQAEGGGSGDAFNELGLICMEGKVPDVEQSNKRAARYFSQACELDSASGCANIAIQFLFLGERRSNEDVARALDYLEQECSRAADWGICFLIGVAYETGRGKPRDLARAAEYYRRCGLDSHYAVKGLARIGILERIAREDFNDVAQTIERSCESGDGESCWYLAYLYAYGIGMPADTLKGRLALDRACKLGVSKACDALPLASLPPYTNPRMLVPGWSSAFPEK